MVTFRPGSQRVADAAGAVAWEHLATGREFVHVETPGYSRWWVDGTAPQTGRGISDLAIDARKFSGNAQYRKSRALLIHGTFLLDFDLSLIGRYLQLPSKQPAYRQNRSHLEFLTKLPVRSAELRERLQESWSARTALDKIPIDRIDMLVQQRYGGKEWSEKF